MVLFAIKVTCENLFVDTLFYCSFTNSDGGSRSGLFCGVSHSLDRMKLEQEVDAFLAVRYVSRRRSQFFQTPVSIVVVLNMWNILPEISCYYTEPELKRTDMIVDYIVQ